MRAVTSEEHHQRITPHECEDIIPPCLVIFFQFFFYSPMSPSPARLFPLSIPFLVSVSFHLALCKTVCHPSWTICRCAVFWRRSQNVSLAVPQKDKKLTATLATVTTNETDWWKFAEAHPSLLRCTNLIKTTSRNNKLQDLFALTPGTALDWLWVTSMAM